MKLFLCVLVISMCIVMPTGFAQEETLVYLKAVGATASSFDGTPDWAPEPDPMAPVDGDMLTRWSSNYAPGEQWIYFDLGEERVVNNVIIRWERAYATKYKVLVSNDAANWQEVYNEIAGEGGAKEIDFNPIKCRYVKILGIERVNEDWGISIWEVEVYGPKTQNPSSTITKEAYLSRGSDDAKKEEVNNLIESMKESPASIDEKVFQKGVVYTSWMSDEFLLAASDLGLVDIRKSGFDTVAIMVPAYQQTIESTEIFTNDVPGGDTPTKDAIRHVSATCHKLGLRVMIKPHVDPRTNEARINIMPSEGWFNSYEKFVLEYAGLAQEVGAELFSVGTELEATTFETWAPRWNDIIDKVRQVFKGRLTYSANWTEYKDVPFWGKMDFVGIDAYFPLTEKNDPSFEELVEAWKLKRDEIKGWLEEKGLSQKGIIFTEIGYPSSDGANRQPWVAITSVEDQAEQADCFKAMFEVLGREPWFKGAYVWQYFPQERWSPLGFTVKGKKAEETIKGWLTKEEAVQ